MYTKRIIDSVLKEYLTELPAILIEGAKAVGKTMTCSHLSKTVFSLDNSPTRLLLTSAPETILNSDPPVLIDEWQLAPELWSYIRHKIDDGLKPGSVLFTGSSIKVNSRIHSGAGRIIRMTLRPDNVYVIPIAMLGV
jgi:predicted AAA+ superfamily ATPase